MQPETIGGRYRIQRIIGRGGMGAVYLADDETLGREVAVKQVGLLPGETTPDSARALREARSTAALSHRNVVTVYDVIDEAGAICARDTVPTEGHEGHDAVIDGDSDFRYSHTRLPGDLIQNIPL